MIHGTETEPEARRAYEFFVDCDVQQVGFVPHPTINMAGASPDGLVGDDGLLELKCPNSATHIETLLSGEIPDKYIKQMQFQMACTGGPGATSQATTTAFPNGCGCSSSG
jgi:predicted phage-related endonuclease